MTPPSSLASHPSPPAPVLRTPVPGPQSRAASDGYDIVDCPSFQVRRKAREPADSGPIVLRSGAGSTVTDIDGNTYVDLAAGFGAALLGHGETPATRAVASQLGVLSQGLGDLFASDVKIELAKKLTASFGMARVLFGQAGADAITGAIKTAVLATGRDTIVAFRGAYHGLSYAPLAVTTFQESFRKPFEKHLNPAVKVLEVPASEAEERAVLAEAARLFETESVAALLIEPVLGRGGVHVFGWGFLRELRELCRAHGALFIADEIWTGMGRTGALWVTKELGPDLVCLGKGLGASFPIAACLGTEEAMQGWARGGAVVHTSTHAGAPIGCVAARATLETVESFGLADRARDLGGRFLAALAQNLEGLAIVRGKGLMVGIEPLAAGGISVFRALLARGFLTTVGDPRGNTLVLSPALTIEEPLLFGFVDAVKEVLS